MKRFALLLCVLLGQLAAAAIAGAAVVSYSGSIPLAPTNWSSAITIPKFAPTLGTLNSIVFILNGQIQGTTRFESLDSQPSMVTMLLSAQLKLLRPDNSTIAVAIPTVTTADNATAFDGLADYGGTSGMTHDDLSAYQSVTNTSPPPSSDLALFTGPGDITLPVIAIGYSIGSGSGNLYLGFSTSASADAVVKYIYDPVPEPSAMLALLSGLGGVAGAVAFRRKRQT